ncbi:hypothetical protein CRUP_034727 [Coryphaenoides rupestris]|nr:hypothetical protein CRUP_034727 [Coryphaenoides rupestris]
MHQAAIVRKRQWCEMFPCLEDEGCDLLVNRSGWTCTQPGGRVKTTTVSHPAAPDGPNTTTTTTIIIIIITTSVTLQPQPAPSPPPPKK